MVQQRREWMTAKDSDAWVVAPVGNRNQGRTRGHVGDRPKILVGLVIKSTCVMGRWTNGATDCKVACSTTTLKFSFRKWFDKSRSKDVVLVQSLEVQQNEFNLETGRVKSYIFFFGSFLNTIKFLPYWTAAPDWWISVLLLLISQPHGSNISLEAQVSPSRHIH